MHGSAPGQVPEMQVHLTRIKIEDFSHPHISVSFYDWLFKLKI